MKQWKHRCELKLLVCQPNPLRPDRVTIGYVLRDTNPDAPRVEVRFAKNLGAVQCIYPEADLEAIEGTLLDLQSVLKNVTDFEKHLLNMPADFPADFTLVSGGALLTDDFEKELPLLEKQYLARMRKTRTVEAEDAASDFDGESDEAGEQIGRPFLRRRMQQAFHRAGVEDLIASDIPVGKYTFEGDLLKIDFGHPKAKSGYRLLHATSVVAGLEQAAVLAAKWPKIRAGLEHDLGQQCELIAVVEGSKFTESQQSHEVQNWLASAGIAPRPLTDMPTLAEEARSYLRP